MPSEKFDVSALLYRFRGTILGVIAVALAVAPPSLFPEKFYINDCVGDSLLFWTFNNNLVTNSKNVVFDIIKVN